MCGICGKTDDPGGTAVAAMNRAMRHRGPDDEGVHTDPDSGVSLGARRLSIIDVEGGHQPLSNEDGSVWGVLNGEIYNHPRLQERLRAAGHELATGVDTEVIVHLYEDLGTDLVYALEGMFTFALWDARNQTLLSARDRFGEKPLFYVEGGGEFAFASELTALLAGVDIRPDLDPGVVDDFFVYGYVPGPEALVRGVNQLPPGHLLRWHRGGRAVVRPYWSPPAPVAATPEPLDDLVVELEGLLEDSVRSRMIADVPLGVFLSGGVDSTLIAALAARVSRDPIKTFTVGYDVGDVSEVEGARVTARELGSEHHELILSETEVAERVPTVLAALDQPLADQSLVAFHAIAEFARREVTTAIGGEGADEVFGGYPRYRWLARAEALGGRLPSPLAKAGSNFLAAGVRSGRARHLADVVRPQTSLERHLDWVTDGRRALRERLYGARLPPGEALVPKLQRLTASVNGSVEGRFMLLDQLHWLPGDVLVKADRGSMLVSLEVRTPYLNHELVEFAATIPPSLHVRRGKTLLRELLSRVLPNSVLRRPKTAFRVPAADWLRGPLRRTMEEQLAAGCLFQEGWFDGRAASALLEEHCRGERDWSGSLWPLLALGLWLDRVRRRDATG
jgi:asparagine synthase (glutamine-hydrolysing)